jgi:hypothetical protein
MPNKEEMDQEKDKDIKKDIREKKTKKKKDKGKCKKKKSVESDIQVTAIYKSLRQNLIFYIILLGCLYAFTQGENNRSSLIGLIISIIFISFHGYGVHYYSHSIKIKFTKFYNSFDNIFTRNRWFDYWMHAIIDFGEFHYTTHHDTSINKSFKNIFLEFASNAAAQGVYLVIFKKLLDLVDNRVILLWAFFYATVHNFNYYFVKPITHQEHHIDSTTNYGIDIWDIIVGSKYNWDNVETHNHAAINMVVLTAIIIYACHKLRW